MKNTILTLCAILSMACVAPQPSQAASQPDGELKETLKEVGKSTKEAAKEFGKETKKVSKKVAKKSKKAAKKVFDELAPRYKDRNGGYTRILKVNERRGDDALMCIIELV